MTNTNKMLIMMAGNTSIDYKVFKEFLKECKAEKLVRPKCCKYLRKYAKLCRGYSFDNRRNIWHFDF